MALRSGHGAGAGMPRIEVLPASEMPDPVAAPTPVLAAPIARRPNGTIAGSEAAKALGKRGGDAKARLVRLVDSLGLAKVVEGAAFGPYRAAAEDFVGHHLESLAAMAGGVVGPGPSTMVASAALQLAASRFCFDKAAIDGDTALMKQGSALANDSRQNLLAAFEMATREAKARVARDDKPTPWLEASSGTSTGEND